MNHMELLNDDKIKELSSEYLNTQERDINNNPNLELMNFKGKQIDERIVEPIPFLNFNKNYPSISYDIYYDEEEVLGNIFIPDYFIDEIESFIIEIGGIRVDKVYYKFYNILQNIYDMKDALPIHILKCGIPYTQYHKVRIYLHFKKNIELSTQKNRPIRYNIHENCHPDYREKMKDNSYKLSFFIFQNQYAGKNCFGFYHPVYKIICLDDSKHSYLKLNKNIYKIIPDDKTIPDDTTIDNSFNIFSFSSLKLKKKQNRTTINFSKISPIKLYFENEYENEYENEEKEIMIINDNIAYISFGLFGLNHM